MRLYALVLIAGMLMPLPAAAQEASVGCQVLLCASSRNPSWKGVPFWVPVMQRLFRDLRRGGSWPSCPEGVVGRPGYEPFKACPANAVPASQGRADDGGLRLGDPSGDLCAVRIKPPRSCWVTQGDCQARYELSPRPRRAEPWFVDIGTPAGTNRFRFSLEQ
jgi:hypothetical protein